MNNSPRKPEFLSIQEAAKKLGVSIETLRRWDAAGILKADRTLGNQRRYTLEQLLDFQSRRKQLTARPSQSTRQVTSLSTGDHAADVRIVSQETERQDEGPPDNPPPIYT